MNSKQPYIYRFVAMTVPCELIIFALEPEALAQAIEENTRRLEAKYNFYDHGSWWNKHVNERQSQKVSLDDESASILNEVRRCSEATDGIFDITIGTLKRLNEEKSDLSRGDLYGKASSFMGLDCWQLEGNQLHFSYPETKMDLGGVIKEYAVDQAVLLAKQAQATGVLVNFGGDIRTLGNKPDGSNFVVAVRNPKDTTSPLFALPLEDQAMTTSAHYERSYQFNDQSSSHILSKEGVHPQVLSSTVVADSALQAGIFSTALTIRPTIELPDDIGVALIDEQLNIHQDSEFISQ